MAYETRQSKDRAYWMKAKKDAIAKHKSGEYLTLEETAAAIWDPKTEKYPMTSMGVLKIEKRALAKLKETLKKYRINDLSDIVEPKYREFGRSSMPENV